MTVFKSFLKILNKFKVPVIMYSVILIVFAALQLQTSDKSTNFVSSKPDILIINKEETGKTSKLTNNLIEYLKKSTNIKEIENTDNSINDALFYRDVNYIIYIPINYENDFLNGLNPQIEVKSVGDYPSSYAEMLLTKYVKVANIYSQNIKNEDELIAKINDTLAKQVDVKIASKLDTSALSKANFYYNFANYSILAGCVYVISLMLSSFRAEKIKKRTIISSMSLKKHNTILLLSNFLFAVVLWAFYVLVSFVLLENVMTTINGLLYIINSFIFMICALTIAFLIGNLEIDKEAINGVVNVIALGSSFLCGAFVPSQYLPEYVVKISKILPSYWYMNNNELIASIEKVNIATLQPIIINVIIILGFCVMFSIISNIISKRKTKIG